MSKPIQDALKRVKNRLDVLVIDELPLLNYYKYYLHKYQDHFEYYQQIYQHFFETILQNQKKPIDETVILDYGGGTGMLSFIAYELGYKKVIYNDCYEGALNSFKTISKALDYPIETTILGSIDAVVDASQILHASPIDLIISFDVIEHIYSLEDWFSTFRTLPHACQVFFTTTANPYQPFIKRRLQRLQYIDEHVGHQDSVNDEDTKLPYVHLRHLILKNRLPEASEEWIETFVTRTRGFNESDILKAVSLYQETGQLPTPLTHPTNTCNPYTGSWSEHLIDFEALAEYLKALNLSSQFYYYPYAYSSSFLKNVPKYALNLILKGLGRSKKYLAPSLTLQVNHRN